MVLDVTGIVEKSSFRRGRVHTRRALDGLEVGRNYETKETLGLRQLCMKT